MTTTDHFDTPLSSLRLVDETALDYAPEELMPFRANPRLGELRFTREQLDTLDNKVLRRLAALCTSDAVNGRSTRLEMVEFFGVQRSLREYE